jgi:hypothetical protein
MTTTDVHPDAVLAALLAKGVRSNRRSNLERLHALCRARHAAGSRDFSLAAIAKLVEAEGILKGRGLYNAAAADYKVLIEAWGSYAGPPVPKAPTTLASMDYLNRIDDPAIRRIMQAIIMERDRLKAQVNTLKAKSQVIIDERPGMMPTGKAADDTQVTVLSPSTQLTPMEREALQQAVSPEYLEVQGLTEGSHGEILDKQGRTLFDMGFTSGLRKLLG